MLIDWFTVGGQALNFLVLAWLLKRFLYRPVLAAIDARESRIASDLGAAAAQQAAAQKELEQFQNKNRALDDERAATMAKAAGADIERRRVLLDDVRKEAAGLQARYADTLRADAARLERQIAELAKHEVFAIARKVLADLAAADLEERMAEVFTRRLRSLDARAKEALAGALHASAEPALLRSSFELAARERASIQNALNEVFSSEVRLRFDTAPEAICGIELTVDGQKLAWSIAEYLAALERRAAVLLAPATATAAAAAAA
jgi:F-type H+-transporting ATPase subunit b